MAVNVTYRLSDDTAPASTTVKGAPLTNAEIDGNFRSIKDAIEDFSESTGSSLVGYDGGTVQDVLDSAKPMQSYTALRAYTSRATAVRITTPGIAGFFTRDSDVVTADNGGTVIVDGAGRRWKRVFDSFTVMPPTPGLGVSQKKHEDRRIHWRQPVCRLGRL